MHRFASGMCVETSRIPARRSPAAWPENPETALPESASKPKPSQSRWRALDKRSIRSDYLPGVRSSGFTGGGSRTARGKVQRSHRSSSRVRETSVVDPRDSPAAVERCIDTSDRGSSREATACSGRTLPGILGDKKNDVPRHRPVGGNIIWEEGPRNIGDVLRPGRRCDGEGVGTGQEFSYRADLLEARHDMLWTSTWAIGREVGQ